MSDQKERLTVDLDKEEKQKLRIVTAMLGERHMQKTVIRLIEEKYKSMNIQGVPSDKIATLPNFHDENAKNFQG